MIKKEKNNHIHLNKNKQTLKYWQLTELNRVVKTAHSFSLVNHHQKDQLTDAAYAAKVGCMTLYLGDWTCSRCTLCCGLWSLLWSLRSQRGWDRLLEAGVRRRLLTDWPTAQLLICYVVQLAQPLTATGFLVCRSSFKFTHCSRPKCSNYSCPSHPVISITRCSQAKFDTCQEPTSRLHASQWQRWCRRLGRLMSRYV